MSKIYKINFCIQISRWLNSFNIATASQHQQRSVAQKWSGDDFAVEETPFVFKGSNDEYSICSAPWGYIKDLTSHIFNYLDKLEE